MCEVLQPSLPHFLSCSVMFGLVRVVVAYPSYLGTTNCDKAQSLAIGDPQPIMQAIPQAGTALIVERGGVAVVNNSLFTPGEALTLRASNGAVQYGLYVTAGTLTGLPTADQCDNKLAFGGSATPETTPATWTAPKIASVTFVGMRASGFSIVTYETLTLTLDDEVEGTLNPPLLPLLPLPLPPSPPPRVRELFRYVTPDGLFDLKWKPGELRVSTSMEVTLSARSGGWVGFAFSEDSQMISSPPLPTVIGSLEDGDATLKGYLMKGKSRSQMEPVNLTDCGVDLGGFTFVRETGLDGVQVSTMSFRLFYDDAPSKGSCGGSERGLYLPRDSPPLGVIFAQSEGDAYGRHTVQAAAKALSADGTSSATVSMTAKLVLIHGLLMGFAWVLIAPLGAATSRFARGVLPKGRWFVAHRVLMILAALMTIGGFAVAVLISKVHFNNTHAQLGLLIFVLTILQPLNGFRRPGHDAAWRGAWDMLHKGLGATLLLLGNLNCLFGSLLTSAGAKLLLPLFVLQVLTVAVAAYREFAMRRKNGGTKTTPLGRKGMPVELSVGLPAPWQKVIDPNTSRVYYVNPKSGESQWEPPVAENEIIITPPPPPDAQPKHALWEEHKDPASGAPYWYNTATGETSWQQPPAYSMSL
mmetsp:Transcript_16877/g.28040  ORF Transcript_16877/g.28040 Transcript_16877/m.28040 type:complete len:641 (+) Transcript_16877:44-1966(+)